LTEIAHATDGVDWHQKFCEANNLLHALGFKRYALDLSAQIGMALQRFEDPDAFAPYLARLEAILAEISDK
jgi:hypothetical protein